MNPLCRSRRIPLPEARRPGPTLQALEPRLLLEGAAPEFATLPTDQWFTSDGALTIGIDGYDADGDALTITVESDQPDLTVFVPSGNRYARLHFVESDGTTPIGDIVVQLFETRGGPAAERFITLATNHVNPDGSLDPGGEPFYSDVVVHRVIPDFMIQTGDAENGDGTGGSPLGAFDDVFDPDLGFAAAGVLAMANSGPDTNDCQFFITDGPALWLNQAHMIFGQVISGYDVLDTIINLPRDPDTNRPNDPPLLDEVEILNSSQDATATFNTVNGWAGEAHVTITLDDGHGNQTIQTNTVTALGDRPQIADPGTVEVAAGQTTSVFLQVTDDGGLPVHLSATTSVSGASATVDSATGRLDVTAPDDYFGIVTVYVTAVEDAYQDENLEWRELAIPAVSRSAEDPALFSRVMVPTGGSAISTQKVGDRLYVASLAEGLAIYDVSDPYDPVLLGSYSLSDYVRHVEVAGDTAFVADTWAGLGSIDVTAPGNMSQLDLEATGSVVVSVQISGDIAFVPGWASGLLAFDISDPTNITQVGSISDLGSGLVLSRTLDVALKGTYAYVTDQIGGFFVIDVSRPDRMKLAAAVYTGGAPWGVEVVGERLYVCEQNGGLLAYDIASPTRPKFLGWVELPGAWQVAVANQLAVAAVGDGFALVDVSEPQAMSVIKQFKSTAQGGEPAIYGTQIALPVGDNGTILLDGTDLIKRTTVHNKFTTTDSAGVDVTIIVKGGTAFAHTSGIGTGDIETLEIIPDSEKASVKLSASGGQSTIGDVIVRGSIKSFAGKGINLGGDMTVEGTIGKLVLGNVDAQHTITIGPRPAEDTRTLAALSFAHVAEASLISQTPLKSVTVTEWIDADATADEIQAPWIGKLTTKGDRIAGLPGSFQADLVLDGAGAVKATLGSAKIAGDLTDVLWNLTGNMGKLTVNGSAVNSTVRTTGSMAGITLGAAHGSDFLAGISPSAGRHATGYSDFQSSRMIGSVKIKGLSTPGRYFTDSSFSAAALGSVSLLNADFDNGGEEFGIFARADGSGKEIRSVKYADKESGEKWKWSSSNGTYLTVQDLTLICHTDHPTATYSLVSLGGGMYGVTFVVRGNDGQALSFFADLTFEGVNGGAIVQQKVILGDNEREVDLQSYAEMFDGIGTPPYDKIRDTYILDPFASGDVISLVQEVNLYHLKAGTGSASAYEEANVAYVVTTGQVHFYGSVARQGDSYPVEGIVLV